MLTKSDILKAIDKFNDDIQCLEIEINNVRSKQDIVKQKVEQLKNYLPIVEQTQQIQNIVNEAVRKIDKPEDIEKIEPSIEYDDFYRSSPELIRKFGDGTGTLIDTLKKIALENNGILNTKIAREILVKAGRYPNIKKADNIFAPLTRSHIFEKYGEIGNGYILKDFKNTNNSEQQTTFSPENAA
jgi:hypothetical protein